MHSRHGICNHVQRTRFEIRRFGRRQVGGPEIRRVSGDQTRGPRAAHGIRVLLSLRENRQVHRPEQIDDYRVPEREQGIPVLTLIFST